MTRLDVQTSKMQPVMIVIAGIIMVPLGVGAVAAGLAGGGGIVPVAIGAMMLATFGLIVWLGRRAHAKSVRYFSSEGLERNDRKWLAWADLERVIYQIRVKPDGEKGLWRIEIRFRNGQTAWLVPLRVRNAGDVSDFLAGLPCDHTEQRV